MRTYIIRRVLLLIPTLLILSIIIFLTVRLLPGDVINAMMADLQYTAGDVDREALERMLGLDVPVPIQYVRWIGGLLLQGTLGESLLRGHLTVEEKIIGRVSVTLQLGLVAIVIGLVIALPVGIYSAVRQDTATDYLGRSIAIIGLATPNFWLALMVMIFPSIWWGWSPPMFVIPFTEDPLGSLGVFRHPGIDSGDVQFCRHDADDAHHDAGSAAAGLYPHPPGPRVSGSGWLSCGTPSRMPSSRLCPRSCPAAAGAGRGVCDHREHLQPARVGTN